MGSFRHLISSSFYWVGCVLLIPGSILLKETPADNAIILYIVACLLLTVGALIDLTAKLLAKPKLEQDSLITESPDKNVLVDWKTGVWIQIFYTLGGLQFLIASILYWPYFENTATTGTWIFRIGSFCYIIGSLVCLKTLLDPYKSKDEMWSLSTKMWMSVLIFYMLGSLCFITGGILSQLSQPFSVEMWIIGSVSFTLGASFCMIEIIRTWN